MKHEPSEFEIALEQQPTAGLWPQPKDAALDLLDRLESIGVTIPNPNKPAALDLIESAFDSAGDQRGAEAIAFIFSNLPGGRRGAELRAALLGTVDGTSAAQTAREFGVSPVTWHKAIHRLRDRLLGKTANALLP